MGAPFSLRSIHRQLARDRDGLAIELGERREKKRREKGYRVFQESQAGFVVLVQLKLVE